jgi:hypothetical protein
MSLGLIGVAILTNVFKNSSWSILPHENLGSDLYSKMVLNLYGNFDHY